MESIDCIIRAARERGCSDIHLTSGQPVSYRRIGRLEPDGPAVGPEETDVLIRSMLGPRQTDRGGGGCGFQLHPARRPASARQRLP